MSGDVGIARRSHLSSTGNVHWIIGSNWSLLVSMWYQKKFSCTSQYPNIIANVRHAWLDEGAVRVMRKTMKLSSDGSDSGRNTCKRGYDGAYGGV
jgi:hypothetical protein